MIPWQTFYLYVSTLPNVDALQQHNAMLAVMLGAGVAFGGKKGPLATAVNRLARAAHPEI